jgi:hypothetical protein
MLVRSSIGFKCAGARRAENEKRENSVPVVISVIPFDNNHITGFTIIYHAHVQQAGVYPTD